MAESHVLFALKRQYARTLGALHAAHCDRSRLMGDLAHLAAVIHMFSPNEGVEAIQPRRPYKPARGRWNRTAMEVLRKANRPLKAFELARLVMSAQGMEPDRRTLESIAYSLQAVLARLQAQGLVVATGKPRRWALARD